VYFSFDFGDKLFHNTTGKPYIQLLSEIDPAKAIAQVASIRGKAMSALPSEMDPTTLVGLLMGASSTDPTPACPSVTSHCMTTDLIPMPTATTQALVANKSAITSSLISTGSTMAGYDDLLPFSDPHLLPTQRLRKRIKKWLTH
jgi:saccharopepsin